MGITYVHISYICTYLYFDADLYVYIRMIPWPALYTL